MGATAEQLREEAKAAYARKAESEAQSDTDGFVSQWASGLTGLEKMKQADIVEAGGIATFFKYKLVDIETGKDVGAKLIRGQFGPCWAYTDEDGNFTGQFVSAHKEGKNSGLYKQGVKEAKTFFVAKAKAKIVGGGKGLAGAASCYVSTVCAEYDKDWDGVACLGDGLAECEAQEKEEN